MVNWCQWQQQGAMLAPAAKAGMQRSGEKPALLALFFCAGSIPYAGRLPPLGSQRATLLASRAAASDTDSDSEAEPLAGAVGCSAAAAPAAAEPACYVIGGLGARGLVYHAWLGRLVAAAVLAGSDEGLPPELLRWKQT